MSKLLTRILVLFLLYGLTVNPVVAEICSLHPFHRVLGPPPLLSQALSLPALFMEPAVNIFGTPGATRSVIYQSAVGRSSPSMAAGEIPHDRDVRVADDTPRFSTDPFQRMLEPRLEREIRTHAAIVVGEKANADRIHDLYKMMIGHADWEVRTLANLALSQRSVDELVEILGERAILGDETTFVWPLRRGKPHIALILVDDFTDQWVPHGPFLQVQRSGHGAEVEKILLSQLGGAYHPDLYRIQAGERDRDRMLRVPRELEELADRHPDTIFIVNASLGLDDPSPDLVNGIFLVEDIKRLGEKGMLIVAAAGNQRPFQEYGHIRLGFPRLANVLVVAAGDAKTGRKTVASKFGRDVILTAPTADHELGKTSYAVPRAVSLFFKTFTANPVAEIPEVLQRVQEQAVPMLEDPYYQRGWLGAGMIGADPS